MVSGIKHACQPARVAGVAFRDVRDKRVDDRSRFYANFRDFRGARVSTLTRHVLKPNAEPVVLALLRSAVHKLQR